MKHIPVIFMTALTDTEDKLKGFQAGGVDYVTKPFSVEELVLRIKAILKRGKILQATQEKIVFSGYELDLFNLVLITAKAKIQLTQKEADILALLVSNQNTLLKREFILKTIWEDDGYFVGRSLDVFISKLRKHFQNDASIKIRNVHGAGYKFEVHG